MRSDEKQKKVDVSDRKQVIRCVLVVAAGILGETHIKSRNKFLQPILHISTISVASHNHYRVSF